MGDAMATRIPLASAPWTGQSGKWRTGRRTLSTATPLAPTGPGGTPSTQPHVPPGTPGMHFGDGCRGPRSALRKAPGSAY